MTEEYFTDYPTIPMGVENPYYCCAACGRSDPQINGRLEGHKEDCSWVKKKIAEITIRNLPPSLDCKIKEGVNVESVVESCRLAREARKKSFREIIKKEIESNAKKEE